MSLAIITSHGMASSIKLRDAIIKLGGNAVVYDVRDMSARQIDNLKGVVFSYGSSQSTTNAKKRYNPRHAVRRCINKVTTFQLLEAAGVPIPSFTTNPDEAEQWDIVVVRKKISGRRNEGMEYWYREEGKPIPYAELYTEYFHHRREYRVVVAFNKVFVYHKHRKGDEWNLNFVNSNSRINKMLKREAKKAATALGIQYVGFDVLVKNDGSMAFLEANSGPIMCDEVLSYLSKKLLKDSK